MTINDAINALWRARAITRQQRMSLLGDTRWDQHEKSRFLERRGIETACQECACGDPMCRFYDVPELTIHWPSGAWVSLSDTLNWQTGMSDIDSLVQQYGPAVSLVPVGRDTPT